jgi:hypothetical protein
MQAEAVRMQDVRLNRSRLQETTSHQAASVVVSEHLVVPACKPLMIASPS